MIRINLTNDIINGYYNTVQEKSTYLGFRITKERLVIFSEYNELLFLSFCSVPGADAMNLRLPVEAMNIVMMEGLLTIEESVDGDKVVLINYDNNNKKRCQVEIASEFADDSEAIIMLLDAITSNELTVIDKPGIFYSALKMANIKDKDVNIKGVSFNSGKIFTIGNGFAAYRADKYNLSLVLSTSSLREIVKFCRNKGTVRLYRQKGYNLIYDGVNIIAWRRVRNEKYYPITEIKYELSVNIDVSHIIRALSCIKTEVSKCCLNFRSQCLEVYSQVGIYNIPLYIAGCDLPDTEVNYSLFCNILQNSKGHILLEVSNNTIHIQIDDIDYYIGVKRGADSVN